MRAIGIDFGTTNCSAAVWHAGQGQLIPLEDQSPVMPSTLCITSEGEVLLGRAAIERYLELTRDTGIRYQFTDLRRLTTVFEAEAEQTPLTESNHGLVVVSSAGEEHDLNAPARLFQSLKTALRDPNLHGTTIYGRYYPTEELISLVLRHIREAAERHLGHPVEVAVIGRPVTYASDGRPLSLTPAEIDRVAHERMLAAAKMAGFDRAALEFEPVAAARHLRATLPPESRALVFDFGGGTLDLALAHIAADGQPEILAIEGVLVGGDDLDSAIMQHALLRHFGHGTTLGPKELPFPPNLLEPLLHWQTIPLLATPAALARIAAVRRQANAPHTVDNLLTLTRQGLGFRLFQRIERAKIQLSGADEAWVRLNEHGLALSERLTRAGFVSAIADQLAEIDRGLARLLASAHVAADEIEAVLLTGGSSLLPVVQARLRQRFGDHRVRLAEPFTSIAAGLSQIAAEDDICVPLDGVVSSATEERLRAEAVTIGDTVAFRRGHQTVEGLVVRRAGGRLHDATLVIEFWDDEIEQFVSTMRHETKVTRVKVPR